MEIVTDMGSARLYRPSGEPGHHQQAQRWFNAADITVAHQRHLLKQLDQQRCQELFCDCSVLVEGQLFRAHRNVLFASSGYFRMLLSPKGSDTASATFDTFSPDTFALILDFIYSGQLDLSSHNVIEVMSAASYLQMTSVINYCKTFIKSSLEISVKEEEEELEVERGGGGGRVGGGIHLMEAQGPFSCGGDDDDDDDDENLSDQEVDRPHHPPPHLRLHPHGAQTPAGSVSPPPALWTHDGAHLTKQVFLLKDPDQTAPSLAARANGGGGGGDGGGMSPAHAELEEANTGAEDLLDPLFTVSGPEQRRRKRGARRTGPYCTRSSINNDPPEVQEARSQKAEKAEELYATLPTIVGVIGQFHNDSNPTMRYKCPFCTHTVKRKADLKRHLRCHTGERPYPCQACNKRFTRLEHLRSHFETIHQARKLVCKKCKCPLTEDDSHVVCEGTRRYRICATCIQEEVGFESLPMEDSLEGLDQEPALLLGVDGEEEGETQRSWLTSMEQEEDEDEDNLAEDSGTDLIIHEVDDSDEEVQ